MKLSEIYPEPPITEYEGWRAFVNRVSPERPIVPTPKEWSEFSVAEKSLSKEERIRWHSQMAIVKTPILRRALQGAVRLATQNYRAPPGARPGFILNGLGAVGKTTILMKIGAHYERRIRQNYELGPYEDLDDNIFLPVAYVTLPGLVAIKAFNLQLVNFYGIPISSRADESTMTNSIAMTARKCGTSLILIDDIHFLEMRNKSSQIVNNHLKSLASRISATFGYAGINLEHSGFLAEGKSEINRRDSQIERRFTQFEVSPLNLEGAALEEVLSQLDAYVCLVHHQKNELLTMKEYIHRRTAGFMGSIVQLVKSGANLAIRNGVERLSPSLFDRVKLDYAAEANWKATSK
jgi:hypothetical protein